MDVDASGNVQPAWWHSLNANDKRKVIALYTQATEAYGELNEAVFEDMTSKFRLTEEQVRDLHLIIYGKETAPSSNICTLTKYQEMYYGLIQCYFEDATVVYGIASFLGVTPFDAPFYPFAGELSDVSACYLSPDDRNLYVTHRWGTEVYDVETGKTMDHFDNVQDEQVNVCLLTSDGKSLFTAETSLDVYDLETEDLGTIRDYGDDEVMSCALTSDDKFLVTACDNGTLGVWDVQKGTEKFTLSQDVFTGDFHVVISSDNEIVLSYERGGFGIRLWYLATGEVLHYLDDGNQIQCCAFSSENDFVIAGSSVNEQPVLKIWNVQTGEKIRTMNITAEAWKCTMLSGQHVLLGCNDGTAQVWDIQTEKCVKTIRPSTEGHDSDCVSHFCCSSDKRFLAIVSTPIVGSSSEGYSNEIKFCML